MDRKANFRLMAVAVIIISIGTGSAWADLEDGLIAHWKLDGNANDSVGNNHGIVHGAILTEGISGQAYYFDGVGEWYGEGDSTFIEIDGNGTYDVYTISLWFKTSFSGPLFSDAHGALGGGSGTHGSPDIRVTNNGQVYIACEGNIGRIFSSEGYNDNQWHHVVGVVNSNTNMVRLYVDGSYAGETDGYNADPLNLDNGGDSNNRVEIGARTRKNTYFKGTIDDVRIYNRALSSEEIQQLYQDGLD